MADCPEANGPAYRAIKESLGQVVPAGWLALVVVNEPDSSGCVWLTNATDSDAQTLALSVLARLQENQPKRDGNGHAPRLSPAADLLLELHDKDLLQLLDVVKRGAARGGASPPLADSSAGSAGKEPAEGCEGGSGLTLKSLSLGFTVSQLLQAVNAARAGIGQPAFVLPGGPL